MNAQDLIENKRRDVQYRKQELYEAAKSLSDRMQRVAQNLEQGYSVNGLGEVQGMGLGVDRLCALFEQEKKELRMLEMLS